MKNDEIIEFKIIDNFSEIGTCSGILGSDGQRNFILFPREYCDCVNV